jgi:hypothetical protein
MPRSVSEWIGRADERFCWEDAERFANCYDGGRERDAILDATTTLQRALRDARHCRI